MFRSLTRAPVTGRANYAAMQQRRQQAFGRAVMGRRTRGSNRGALLRKRYGMTPELRGCDTALTTALGFVLATVTTNGAVIPVNVIQQGTGSFNRLGRKITMKSLRVRIACFCRHVINAGLDLTGNNFRMCVVYDRQSSGTALPTFDEIFGQTDQQGTETGTVFDSLRYDNTGRFTLLREKIISSNPMAIVGTTSPDYVDNYFFCDEYIKLPNLVTIYNSTANPATITNISSGALYVIFRGELNASVTSSAWAVNPTSFARLRYYD